MTIVTFTSDLGLQDYYAGAIKGAILSRDANVQIIDITHQIKSFDIVQGAFALKNAYANFPKGSIHLASVNNYYGPDPRFVAFEQEGHFFVGPDNGIFSLMFDPLPKKIFALPALEVEDPFPIRKVYADAVAHILSKKPLKEIGEQVKSLQQRFSLQPVTSKSRIRGTVIYIDQYENVIVNIGRSTFEHIGQGRDFSLFFKRHDPITKLSKQYSDVPVGEVLCLFNSADLLEIAIHMGKAGSLLALQVDDSVQIDFH